MSRLLLRLIDSLYIAPVARFVPRDTFRYAAVGGLNLALNCLIYFVTFHFLLGKQDTSIFGIIVISPAVMAFLVAFVITFCSGFWLTRTIAFGGSALQSGVQLFRYCQVVALNIAINYFGIKLLVDVCKFYPTPSYLGLQIITVLTSYVASKYYTFK